MTGNIQMQNTSREIIVTNIVFIIFWVLVVNLIWLVGARWKPAYAFRTRMFGQWRPALVVTLIYLVSNLFSGRGLLNPNAIAIFCQVMIGLAVALGIPNNEPLPITKSISRREQIIRSLVLLIVAGILAGFVGMLLGSFGLGIAQSFFHETNQSREAIQSFSVGKIHAFFLFLSGAGIAEETTYRLVVLSLIWSLTKRHGLAIFVSAILFGAYHLTPLDGMYLTFWRFPISQFIVSTLIGLLWGWVFVKRGYETTVLAHTMSDWIPVVLFLR